MKHAMRGNTVLKIVCYAYDILVLCRSRADLETMMNIIAKKFENFGLKLAESKTVTMTWNTDEDTKNEESLITVNGVQLKNVREFRYLGHTLTNEAKPKYLTSQIGLAYAAWNDHKKMLTDRRINLRTRVRIAESVVRSRLTYALQTDRLPVHDRKKLDSIWFSEFCVFMAKTLGFQVNLKSAPTGRSETTFSHSQTY